MRVGPKRDLYGAIVNASLQGRAARDIAKDVDVSMAYVRYCRARARARGFDLPRDPYSKGGGRGAVDAGEGNGKWKALIQ